MRNLYIVVFLVAIPFVVFAEMDNSEWIKKAQLANAHTLDTSLPNEQFVKWFSGFVGKSSKISWEVNDCGEQDGSEKQRDFPVCVESRAILHNDKKLAIMVVLGTHKKGIVGKPKIWMIYVEDKGNYNILKNIEDAKKFLAKQWS